MFQLLFAFVVLGRPIVKDTPPVTQKAHGQALCKRELLYGVLEWDHSFLFICERSSSCVCRYVKIKPKAAVKVTRSSLVSIPRCLLMPLASYDQWMQEVFRGILLSLTVQATFTLKHLMETVKTFYTEGKNINVCYLLVAILFNLANLVSIQTNNLTMFMAIMMYIYHSFYSTYVNEINICIHVCAKI